MPDEHLTPDLQPTEPQQSEAAPKEAFPFAADSNLEGSTVILKKSKHNPPPQPGDDEPSNMDGSTLIIRR